MDGKTNPNPVVPSPTQGAFPSELRWTVHPLRDEPLAKSGVLIAIILGLSGGIAVSFGGIGYGFVSLALLAAALSRYFVPTRCALDAAGVQVAHLASRRRMPWEQVRRVRVYPEGVFLSPFDRPHRLESFRGCFLRFVKNRDEVIRFVHAYVPSGTI